MRLPQSSLKMPAPPRAQIWQHQILPSEPLVCGSVAHCRTDISVEIRSFVSRLDSFTAGRESERRGGCMAWQSGVGLFFVSQE